jgi:glutaconyl-CoA decarboxylase
MKKFKVIVNGEPFEVEIEEAGTTAAPVAKNAPAAPPAPKPAAPRPAVQTPNVTAAPKAFIPAGAGAVTAPMPGSINDVKVKAGDKVSAGDTLLILEAMKMENEITAPVSGTVKEVNVQKGQTVNNGDVLVIVG